MTEHTGWLLDIYTDPQEGGLVLWLLGEDGHRHRLRQHFPVTFYAAGEPAQLRALWRYLRDHPAHVYLSRTQRRDLFSPQPLTVMSIQVADAARQPRLFWDVKGRFPDLDYYDADIRIFPRHAAVHDVFPLARCRVTADEDGWVQRILPLDSRWDIDLPPPPLRILLMQPNSDPFHAPPTHLHIRYGRNRGSLPLTPERPLLVNLSALLRRYDPDLLLTNWGDTWLLPHLLKLSQQLSIPLPLNRDSGREVTRKKERTYFTYGQVIHRGGQVFLHGRWHIDGLNAMMFSDYELEGAFEMARVSGLPVQVAARNSPGSGITAMQVIVALRKGILVPYHKQQTERYKSASDLIRADRGGLVYQPLIGLHRDVAEIDFISMYPSIMRVFNISPETVGGGYLEAADLPELENSMDLGQPGLLPETLAPLLDKRIALKAALAEMHPQDCRYQTYKTQSSALKWLLVVCFGYTGYKNAKFGRIESHQAITAYAREALLRAKEAAEDLGFTVLHMYVDGLWVQKPGAAQVPDFQPLLDEIVKRTRLPIALDGIYRWVAFLPSRMDSRVPVPNRYFGVFQNGEIKVRGIEARRGDTPKFIAQTQMDALRILAQAPSADELHDYLPEAVALLRQRLNDLRAGKVDLERMLVRQRLSRALEEYRVPSPSARAAGQLAAVGKTIRVGQSVRFLYVRGAPRVLAWDLPISPNPAALDLPRYAELLLRAGSAVLGPLGVSENTLRDWLFSNAGYGAPPGIVVRGMGERLPLWMNV